MGWVEGAISLSCRLGCSASLRAEDRRRRTGRRPRPSARQAASRRAAAEPSSSFHDGLRASRRSGASRGPRCASSTRASSFSSAAARSALRTSASLNWPSRRFMLRPAGHDDLVRGAIVRDRDVRREAAAATRAGTIGHHYARGRRVRRQRVDAQARPFVSSWFFIMFLRCARREQLKLPASIRPGPAYLSLQGPGGPARLVVLFALATQAVEPSGPIPLRELPAAIVTPGGTRAGQRALPLRR